MAAFAIKTLGCGLKVFQKKIVFLSLLCFWSCQLCLAAEFYLEQKYVARKDVVPNFIRYKQNLTNNGFFLQAGNESSFAGLDQQEYSLEKSSFFFTGPGWEYKIGSLKLIGEVRFRQHYEIDKTFREYQNPVDMRALVVWGHFWQGVGKKIKPISEIYSETVFTSADKNNIIHTDFWRLGFRHQLSANWHQDYLSEAFVAYDKNEHFYYRKSDIKLGLRVGHRFGRLNHSLSANYVITDYFKSQEFNPYREDSNGIVLLYVLGADL